MIFSLLVFAVLTISVAIISVMICTYALRWTQRGSYVYQRYQTGTVLDALVRHPTRYVQTMLTYFHNLIQHVSHFHSYHHDLHLYLILFLHTQILEAVQTCGTLEVVGADFRGRNEESDIMSYSSILATRIRCAENPLSWVPMQMSPDTHRFSGDASPEMFGSEQ